MTDDQRDDDLPGGKSSDGAPAGDAPGDRPLTSAELMARRRQQAEARGSGISSAEVASGKNGDAPPTRPAEAKRPRRERSERGRREGARRRGGSTPTQAPVARPDASPPGPDGREAPSSVPAGAVIRPARVVVGPESPSASVFVDPGPPYLDEPVAAVDLLEVAYDADPRNWATLPRRSGPLTRLLIVGLVLLLMGGFAYRMLDSWVERQIDPPGGPGEEIAFTVEEGWTTNDVASELAAEGIVGNAALFRHYLNCPTLLRWILDCSSGGDHQFQAGQYTLAEDMSFDEIIQVFEDGPAASGPDILVTVREGLTLGEIARDLVGQLPGFNDEELVAAMLSPELRWSEMPPEAPIIEGLLFPETYAIDEAGEQDELLLLQRMRQEFDRVVGELDIVGRSAALGITPYEAVIVASLIEEEAKIDEDRPKIARVIYNRLAAGWSLGIDATTRYAVGKPPGQPLTISDLNDPSPYNTRNPNVIGLPPTPIAAPGRASLEAALNPADGPWMYYVLTDEGGVAGAHRFVTTEAEFAEALAVCRELEYCG